MTMNSQLLLRISVALGLITVAACNTLIAYPTVVARPAQDAPERFLRADSTPISGTPGSAICTSPILDPRTGARLTMVRAYRGSGDYSVPAATYGVGTRELLRVDCATGAPIGIVHG